MNKPLFDIDRKDLQITLTHYQPGNGLAWSTLFPLKSTRRFELKGLEGNEGIAVSAERVAFNTKAPLKTRETIGTWSGKLGKIAVSRQKDEEDINDYNDLKAIAANSDDQQAANDMLDRAILSLSHVPRRLDWLSHQQSLDSLLTSSNINSIIKT